MFDVYCLEEATPGSIHTGYYWISYEFVYVGNHHVRNLLILSSLLSIAGAIALFVTSCFLINALRFENQTGFVSWLSTMAAFSFWRLVHLLYSSIVNDLIFGYHIFTFFSWLIFSTVSVMAWVVVFSLYHELRSLERLEDITKYKLDVSSRAGSIYGQSRGATPYCGTFSRQPSGSNFGTLQSGIYSASIAYVTPHDHNTSLYTSTPRVAGEDNNDHLYATLNRGEQIYSTIIN